jgi:predicted RNA-binding protein YlqC (UPF0109 family)
MKEFIAYLVKNMVDLPDFVTVNVFEGQTCTIVEIQVADGDIAKLVGRQGRIIKSLRTIVMTVGARFGRKIKVELLQNKPSE